MIKFESMLVENIGKTIHFQLKNVAFSSFDQDSEYQNIMSPFSRLYLIKSGTGHLFMNGEKIYLEPDHMYLIPSFTACSYFFQKNLEHFYIHFSVELTSGVNFYHLFSVLNKIQAETDDQRILEKCLSLNPGYALPHHDPKIYQTKPWMIKPINYASLAHFIETNAIIAQLFSRFVNKVLKVDMNEIVSGNFQAVLNYIHKNLSEDLSVGGIAELNFTSKDHFSRKFRRVMGLSPSEYIIRKRLEKAKLLLLTTDKPLSEIISSCGFKSKSYFCRIFKKYTGATPKGFRKSGE